MLHQNSSRFIIDHMMTVRCVNVGMSACRQAERADRYARLFKMLEVCQVCHTNAANAINVRHFRAGIISQVLVCKKIPLCQQAGLQSHQLNGQTHQDSTSFHRRRTFQAFFLTYGGHTLYSVYYIVYLITLWRCAEAMRCNERQVVIALVTVFLCVPIAASHTGGSAGERCISICIQQPPNKKQQGPTSLADSLKDSLKDLELLLLSPAAPHMLRPLQARPLDYLYCRQHCGTCTTACHSNPKSSRHPGDDASCIHCW